MALILDHEIASRYMCALLACVPTWFRDTAANRQSASECYVKYACEPVSMNGGESLADNWPILSRLEDEAFAYAVVEPRSAWQSESPPAFDTLILGRVIVLSDEDVAVLNRYDFDSVEETEGWTVARRGNSVGRHLR